MSILLNMMMWWWQVYRDPEL